MGDMALQAGDKAPNFKLESDAGKVCKAGLKGKPYVVYFYPKDDTSGCTKEAHGFLRRRRKIREIGGFCPGRVQGQPGQP